MKSAGSFTVNAFKHTEPCLSEAVFQVGTLGTHQRGIQGQNHFPWPAGHSSFDAAQDTCLATGGRERRLSWGFTDRFWVSTQRQKGPHFGRRGKFQVTRHWSSEHTATFTVMSWLSAGYPGQALPRANARAHVQVQMKLQHGTNSPLLRPAHGEEERSYSPINWQIFQALLSLSTLQKPWYLGYK